MKFCYLARWTVLLVKTKNESNGFRKANKCLQLHEVVNHSFKQPFAHHFDITQLWVKWTKIISRSFQFALWHITIVMRDRKSDEKVTNLWHSCLESKTRDVRVRGVAAYQGYRHAGVGVFLTAECQSDTVLLVHCHRRRCQAKAKTWHFATYILRLFTHNFNLAPHQNTLNS